MSAADPPIAPRILPAVSMADSPKDLKANVSLECDHCHTKKTRCDRQDPCGNCVVGKLACLRLRPRQTAPNKNSERLDAVLQRMAQLEQTIKTSASAKTASPARRSSTAASNPSEVFSQYAETVHEGTPESRLAPGTIEDSSSRKRSELYPVAPDESSIDIEAESPRKRLRKQDDEEERQTPEDKMLANLDLNRYLRLDKQTCDVDKERQNVIESAIRVAKSVAMANPPLKLNTDSRPNFYDASMYPTAELLHLLFHESSKDTLLAYSLVHFSAVSWPLLEEMAFALIDHTAHDQRRIQYIICVNHVVYAFLMAFKSEQSPRMRLELANSRQRYRENIMNAIAHLDIAVRPDISLLYALQSAAMIMQDTGRMRKCWRFNSLACQVGANISETLPVDQVLSKAEMRLLRLTYIRSYAFNSALSANIYQPACAAKLEIDRSVLDTKAPEDAVLETLLSFAEVQEVIIQETKNCASHQENYQINVKRVAGLTHQMRKIRLKIEEYRAKSKSTTNDFLKFEWLCLDFIFYSMMTSIIRLGATQNDSHAHFSCLENARQSLSKLKQLLDIWDECDNPDLYGCSLAWVIPLFPLRPIYFVFTNVVATSDALDLRILEDIAGSLSKRIETNPSVFQIHRLCASLIGLYKRYNDRVMNQSEAQRPAATDRDDLASTQAVDKFQHISDPRATSLSDHFSTQQENGHFEQIPYGDSCFDFADGQETELSPWDPGYFDRHIDWDLVNMQQISNLLQWPDSTEQGHSVDE